MTRPKKMKKRDSVYHYTECGLDVYIEGLGVATDDAGEETFAIPYVNLLHKAIARGIVEAETGMSPQEVRFLRTEMGRTQDEFARLLKVSRMTIHRWETGENQIDGNAEAVIRMLAVDDLNLPTKLSTEEIVSRCVQTADMKEIRIDGSDPTNYRPLAA